MTAVRALLLLWVTVLATHTWSHTDFGNRLQMTPGDDFWTLQWSAPVDELNLALGLDKDDNQLIHWWEIEAKQAQIIAYAREHFACSPRLSCGPLQDIGSLQLVLSNEQVGGPTGARLLIHFRLPIYDEIEALHINWLLAQNPYRPLVLQWFRGGEWGAESIHIGPVIQLSGDH